MSKTSAILITFFLGGLGVHRFMAGKIGTGSFTRKDGTLWVTEK